MKEYFENTFAKKFGGITIALLLTLVMLFRVKIANQTQEGFRTT